MGKEMQCTARFGGKLNTGKALLETNEIIFGGERSLRIPLKGAKATASRGRLNVVYSGGEASFDLGEAAGDWLHRILNPKSRIEKLGVKPGMRTAAIGIDDAEFLKELKASQIEHAERDCDLIFFGVSTDAELKRLGALRQRLKPAGALWTIRPKGSKGVTEKSVMAAGKAAGLVDIKVVSFSATHTAEKFVIPVAKRSGK